MSESSEVKDKVFFKNVYYDRKTNKVYVQEVINGEENTFVDSFVRTVYVPDKNGTHEDIYGNKVKPMTVDYDQVQTLRNMYSSRLCGSDIPEEVQYIANRYYKYGEMVPDFDSFNVCTMDIEVESEKEFPKPEDALYPINLISYHSSKTGRVTTFGNRPYTGSVDIDYHYYQDEAEMLKAFVKAFRKNKFNIITGWLVRDFDIHYIINRCERLNVDCSKLSPYNIVNGRLGKEVMGKRKYYATIAGISILDYLELYDNFTFETRESYTLNYIGMFEVQEGKLDLDGQVNNEWKNNWNNFVDYNIQDVMLVTKIDNKKKFLKLAILMGHESLISFEKVLSSVAVIEGLIGRDNREHNVVMPDRNLVHHDNWKQLKLYDSGLGKPNGRENDPDNEDEEDVIENGVFKDFYIKGGHVEAYPGWYKDVLSFDVESEYPHMIMAYNISPETKVFNPSLDRIKSENLIRSAISGVYFRRQEGILPRITRKVFSDRKHFKNLMNQYRDRGDLIMAAYYDSMQHIRKIQVNSIYGVMGSRFFHFYDVDCARAVTRGGRQMIRYLANGFDTYFYKHFHKEWNKIFPEAHLVNPPVLTNKIVCLIDTDSNYLTFEELVEKYFPGKSFKEVAEIVEDRIMNPLIARLLGHYWNSQSLENIVNFKREGVILDMVILAKKKYIKHIWKHEKETFDTPKVKYTGVEVVRSDVPRFTRDELDSFYKNLFKLDRNDPKGLRQGCLAKVRETKKVFKNLNIEKISFNSSVKEYTKYAQPVEFYVSNGLSYPKHCPVHTRASINYNFVIKKLNLPYQPVGNGSKVKYGYVKSKNKKLIDQDVIAYMGNFPEEFKKIFDVDWKKQFNNSYLSPVQKLFDVLHLGDANENENVGKFFED